MSDFINNLEQSINGDENLAFTENNAVAFKSTKSAVLDFFATGGALRTRDEESALGVFQRAFTENPLLATKALFYFRDIRGGQGERRTFRILLKWLAENYPEIVIANIDAIPEYGRWDDLYTLFDTPAEAAAIVSIKKQLARDIRLESPSLLAKWLKSENTSSAESRELGRRTRKALGISSQKQYRKLLSELRKRIDLVEQRMSSNDWQGIEYDKLPSKAGLLYRRAFERHDSERYTKFLEDVKAGKKTINASTLYPYEIVEKAEYSAGDSSVLDALWNALPDYFDGNETRGLVVADTSGSMYGRPLQVSISLAMYTAERNKGPFANKFITFSSRPKLQTVKGETIVDKVRNLSRAHWDNNTDIEAVFELILNTAVKTGATQEDLPTHLYIVSDMEFDAATGTRYGAADISERLFQTIERRYTKAGYKMPFLVFWNVNSRNDQQPMSMDQRGFQLVSGCSPSIFTSLLANKAVSAYDLMLAVLNSERYQPIVEDREKT